MDPLSLYVEGAVEVPQAVVETSLIASAGSCGWFNVLFSSSSFFLDNFAGFSSSTLSNRAGFPSSITLSCVTSFRFPANIIVHPQRSTPPATT